MDLESERLERSQLETLSTAELIRHALAETRLLVRAEVMHAKKELREELKAARTAGILLGAGAVLALTALAVLFVALGLALPMAQALGVLVVGVVLLAIAGVLLFVGRKRVPKKPLPHTQERLKMDYQLTRETLQ
ncbi:MULTISPECIES: phage holin family protein [Myxococcus]|uniref:phage holin family protein n=1 Tax=Myxococcus TaxID=32 RepID=UPI0004780E30|nr:MULTISPECIES: phage holin family protein [Myxococcus]NOJ51226.1 phage holin family protein [Myxococcus xanthus]QPM79202.1 phage holin family protein [Myxococcus xanthus]QVW68280.1 phage holin family protein [Myxococcus xanthus DZ2]UEO05606.1 phage holin family protein [Myxococcus xanthus DZ2]UYI14157.1 phage holin family protein [Myxococcus xanthus]